MKAITSIHNEKIKEVLKLRDKDFFWWEGYNFYTEILKEGTFVENIFVEEDFYKNQLRERLDINYGESFIVSKRVFEKLSFTQSPQWIGGIIEKPNYNANGLLKKGGDFFYLAGLQDPGNVGAIIRIADAFHFKGIIYERRGSSPYNEKSVRSSTGSILRVPCIEGNIDTLYSFKEAGYGIYFLTSSSNIAKDINKIGFKKRNVFVLGQEGQGIDINFQHKEDVYIPISKKVDSLNVSVTAGIVAFYLRLGVKGEKA